MVHSLVLHPNVFFWDHLCQVDLPMLPSLEKNTQVAQHYEVGATRTPDPSAHNGTENEGGNAGGAPRGGMPAPLNLLGRTHAVLAIQRGRCLPGRCDYGD